MANEFKVKKGLIVAGATGGTALDVQGSQGQLFSVTDDLSGSIFAVSDISGVPILDVNSNGVSYFDGPVGIGIDAPLNTFSIESTNGTLPLIKIRNKTNGGGAAIEFNDNAFAATSQNGTLTYYHSDSASQGGGSSFWLQGEPDTTLVVGNGTNTGRVVVGGNSETEVGYGFYNDINTGMFKPANHQLGFSTNGTTRLTITDTVTTFSSDATFENNIEVNGEIVQTSTGGENQFASPLNMGSNEISDLANPTDAQDAATKAYVDAHGGGLGPFLPLSAGSGERVTGDLYISDKLYMRPSSTYGNGYKVMHVTGTGNAPYPTIINFSNYAKPSVMVINDENVGIGITTPSAKLHIANEGEGEFAGANSSSAGGSHLMLKDEGSTSRTLMSGPSVVFQTPANADGTNVWSTSRVLGSPAAAGSARGTISLQVRDQYDPLSDGTSWNWRTALTAINTGNVGIGTTSPGVKLDVTDVIRGRNSIRVDGAATGSPYFGLYQNGSEKAYIQYVDSGDNLTVQSDGIVTLKTGSTERMRITSGGNVGIETTTPIANLEVGGASATLRVGPRYATGGDRDFIDLIAHGSDTKILSNNERFHIENNSGNIIINPSGNVGIGTTSPGYKLEVDTNGVHDGIKIRGANAPGLTLQDDSSGSTSSILIQSTAAAQGNLRISADENNAASGATIEFKVSGDDKMRILANGNIGIGTTTPSAKLDVQGTQGQLFSVTDDLSGDIFSVADISGVPIMNVNSDGTSYFDGNVGIGTDSPATYLQIGDYPNSNINITTYPDIPSEHMIHLTAPETTGRYGGGISFGENAFTAANITAQDAGGNGSLHMLFGTRHTSGIVEERMRITSNGSVGIGTTSPGRKLEVDFTGSVYGAKFTRSDATGSSLIEFANSAGVKSIIGYDAGVDGYKIGTASATNFVVKQSGNVGIGTTSPSSELEVNGNILASNPNAQIKASSQANVSMEMYSTSTDSAIMGIHSGTIRTKISNTGDSWFLGPKFGIGTGTPSNKLEVVGGVTITSETPTKLLLNNTKNGTWTAGEALGLVEFYGNDTSGGGAKVQSSIEVLAQDQYGAHFNMTFNLSKGSSGNAELMRLTGEGRLGIATTNPESKLDIVGATNESNSSLLRVRTTDNPNAPEKVVGFYVNTNTERGFISVNQYSTAYSTSSDYRLKENIVPISNSIERLKELKPCRFNFIQGDPNYVVDGFIAHEAAEVIPEAVTGEKDAVDEDNNPSYQGIDQSKVVPLLTAALQEAISKIEQLETRIQTLENN